MYPLTEALKQANTLDLTLLLRILCAIDKLLSLDITYAQEFQGQNSVACTFTELEGFDSL